MKNLLDTARQEHRTSTPAVDQRSAARRAVYLPARLTWKDQRGAARFATVVIRNVSEIGAYVESSAPLALPLYRLVQCQLERDARDEPVVPAALRQGRVLSAVYRVSRPAGSSGRHGIALRLLVDPRRLVATSEPARATA
jgi:hypothetical protein